MPLIDILKLTEEKLFPSVTIQIPTHLSMPEQEQDPIRVKKSCAQAEKLLEEKAPRFVELFKSAIKPLIENINYEYTRDGIVILWNPHITKLFIVPFPISEKVTVETFFDIEAILRGLDTLKSYWVLVLAQNPSRLFLITGDHIEEIIEPVKDKLGIERDGFPFDYFGPKEKHALAIGTGDQDSRYLKDQLRAFFSKVDHLLHKFIVENPVPIIIMGTQEDIYLFEDVSKHKQFIVGHVLGSYSKANLKEIFHLALPKIDAHELQERSEVVQQFIEAIGSTRHAFGIDWVERVAAEGRVHILLIEDNFASPSLDKLINLVRAKKGKIIFVNPGALKDYQHIGAILRY